MLNGNIIISGIWADDSDEDELSARPSFKTFDKGPKNYTTPVNFVAGGIQQAGKPKDEADDKDDDESDNDNKLQREFPNSSRYISTISFRYTYLLNVTILIIYKLSF